MVALRRALARGPAARRLCRVLNLRMVRGRDGFQAVPESPVRSRTAKGVGGGGAHRASLGDCLRRAGYVRERRWRAGVSGFRALGYPPGSQ